MDKAFEQAEEALAEKEVPVGCVFVYKGEVIARGRNRVNELNDASRHAELVALDQLVDWCDTNSEQLANVLSQCDLYVTVEPCIMCAAALRSVAPAQVRCVYYGASNGRFGGCGSVLPVHDAPFGNSQLPRLNTVSGLQADRAVHMLKQFYKDENLNAPPEFRKKK
ncbi:tRNA-specific adenosine deaminase 2 [Cichlidogyrus casuarinus]|uniref:tRNA-specific adenosine deaminase 2 n=1 Tax=Cichlidogyrus casuarinus TaxID=1844966 RepID=A0ABD2PVA6_9PLAT